MPKWLVVMLTTVRIPQCLLWVKFYKMTWPQHINSYLVNCTNKTLWCSLTSMVKHLILVNGKNNWSVIQQIWPLFDLKTSIHKWKIVSGNGKQKNTRHSVIRRKLAGTMEPERKKKHRVFFAHREIQKNYDATKPCFCSKKNLQVLLLLLKISFI